jgi:hypothetical protein
MQRRSNEVGLIRRFRDRGRRSSPRTTRRRVLPAVEQFEGRTLLSLSIGTNFTAADYSQSLFIPPDTQGAAGPTQLVETINGAVSVYSKTGTRISQTSLNSFFNTALAAGGGGTVTNYAFDPRIIYDEQSQRFFVSGDNNVQAANSFIIAVSNSSDATAGWKALKVSSDPTNTRWMDYPTLGLNHDGVYLGGTMFPISGSGATTALTDILVIPKADLVSGVGVTHATLFANLDPNTTGFSVQPLVDLNSGQGQPELLLSDYNTPSGVAKLSEITGTVTAPVLNTSPTLGDQGGGFLTIPAQPVPIGAPQLGDSNTIDTGDTRFSAHVIEQGTNIWAVQGVSLNNGSGPDAIEWYRISVSTGAVVEDGTISFSSLYYYYPSIAVNESGDVVIGFSGSSSSTYVGAYAVTGTFNGTTTTLGSPQLLKAGTGPYFIQDNSSGRNRWGDYSAVVLDPNDHQTFWAVQEWASTVGTSVSNSNYGTQFTAFGVQQTVTGVSSTAANGTYGVGASIPITVSFTKPVVVTGTPQLALNSGGTASFTSGSGTNTLTYTYTVASGQSANPLDEVSTFALTLNGGTINDANSGVPAVLTLPAPGSNGSLGANKSIQVDTVAPTVLSYDVVFGTKNLTYNLIGSNRFDLPWKITGIEVVFSKPIDTADVNSLTGLSTTGLSGLGTNSLVWSITTISLGTFSTALLNSGAHAIKDAAGNTLANPFDQDFKVLYGDFNGDGVVSSADMLGVYYATMQSYNSFADLNGDGVVDLNDIQIARSQIGKQL